MDKRSFLKTTSALALGTALLPHWACGSRQKEEVAASKGTHFSLPALEYPHDALLPYIDKMTMEIHHGKHHGGYVNNLNKALDEGGIKVEGIEALLRELKPEQTALRNNGGGHYNHELFWRSLQPNPKGEALPMPDKLRQALEANFTSVENFLAELKKAAMGRFGSGWAWLCKDLGNGKLFISSTPNQDNPLMSQIVEQPGLPLLGIDVWEHAYYLNYQNRRTDYLEAILKIVRWERVAENL